VTGGALEAETPGVFQPMNVNFGLFPPVEVEPAPGRRKPGKKERRSALVARARADLASWLAQNGATEMVA